MNKKTLKNTIVLSLVAIVLVVTTVLTTVAYLRESAIVTNTFTVGNVAITMDESAVNEDGEKILDSQGNPVNRVTNNHYLLQPDLTYVKDPVVHVAQNSEDMYLFIVAENTIRSIEDPATAKGTMKTQMEANGWKLYKELDVNTNVYVYAKGATSDGSTVIEKEDGAVDIKVFEEFSVKKDADVSTYGAARVIVRAYAIQASSFGTYGSKAATDAAWQAAVDTFDGIVDTNTSVTP